MLRAMITKNIKHKYKILLSLLAIFMMGACADSIVDGGDGGAQGGAQGDDLIPVTLNLKGLFGDEGASTYSLIPGVPPNLPGTGNEENIADVTVFIFNSADACEKVLQKTSVPFTPTDTVLVTAGAKKFIAVVNGIGKIAECDPGYTNPITYNGLRQSLTTPVLTALPTNYFLMTGEKSATLTPDLGHSSPNEVTVDVERAVAKIKVFVTKSGDAIPHNIRLKSVTLNNGAAQVYLMPQFNPSLISDPPVTYGLSRQKDVLPLTDGVIPAGGVAGNPANHYMLLDTFYTYEVLARNDKSLATYIDLEAEVNSNVKRARVYLGEDIRGANDTIYDLKRNHWYNLYVNITNAGMDSVKVTVVTCPWNVADTMKEISGGGGEFKSAIPFKLVKNYTETDLANFGTNTNAVFAAIDKHTKGASWVDVRVSTGMKWKLNIKDNSARNQNVRVSVDEGKTWSAALTTGGIECEHNGSDNDTVRVYIYRPYVEDAEPDLGPILFASLSADNGATYQYKQDLVIQPRDLTPFPTNSYIMRPQLIGTPANETRAYIPLAGVYSYWEDYLLDNGDSIPGGNTTSIVATIGWADAGVIQGTPTVINPNKRDSAYILVQAGATPGNAVVDMRLGSTTGTIYWSFHLWVTEYNPYEAAGQKLYVINASRANVFMDRNLGALANNGTGTSVNGLYYQFGRKDPFRANSVSIYASMPGGSSSLRPLTAIPIMINYPTRFYTGSPWTFNSVNENGNLWNSKGGNKTVFDPCPEGWRIPIQNGDNTSFSPWNGLDTKTDLDANAGYYPLAGYINTGGSHVNSDGYYWTSWPGIPVTGIDSKGISIIGSAVTHSFNLPKNTGRSVRCVVDRAYIDGGGTAFKNTSSLKNEVKQP